MPPSQREVYFLEYPPPGVTGRHPHIVLSVKESNGATSTFVAAMITTSDSFYDDYSFDLTDAMFDRPLAKDGSHVRMHLVTLCLDEDRIGPPVNKMKKFHFDQLMKTIGEMVFGFDFSPQ